MNTQSYVLLFIINLLIRKTFQDDRPIIFETPQTSVLLSMTIKNIRLADLQNLNFEVDLILNQEWTDPRLRPNNETMRKAVSGQIWKPNIVSISGETQNVLSDIESFWRGFGDHGHILLSEKLKLKMFCSGTLRKFPFDHQFCELKFSSYRFPLEEVLLKWIPNNPVEIEGVEINEFDLKDINVRTDIDIRRSGNFSIGVVQFTFSRSSDYYIITIIVPCIFLTLLNYITLWVDREDRNSCILINLIIFISSMTYHLIVTIILVKPTRYLKALDAFTLFTYLMTLIVLIFNIMNKFLINDRGLIDKSKFRYKFYFLIIRFDVENLIRLLLPVFYGFGLLIWGKFFL